MAETSKTVQNASDMKADVLSAIKKKVAKMGLDVNKLSKKWDDDVSKIIQETINFYARSGIKLPAEDIANHIFQTNIEKRLPKKQEKMPEDGVFPSQQNQTQNKNTKEQYGREYSNANSRTSNDPYREDPKENQESTANNDAVSENSGATPNQQTESGNNLNAPVNKSGGEIENKNGSETGTTNNATNPSVSNSANTSSNSLPPKLNGTENTPTNSKKEESTNTNQPPVNAKNNLGQNLKNIRNVLSQNKTPKKLAFSTWILLGAGAVIIDFAQGWIGATIIASIANLLADFFIGLCLFTFFWYKKILDRRLAISLILAFLIDFVSLGIMPAWSFDIAYAWFITDGKKVIGAIPGAGEKVEEIVEKMATKKP